MDLRQSNHERRAGPTRRGFSLIELIAVVVVVGILSVTATVSMSGVPANRQVAAARQAARTLSWLRERAMSTGYNSFANVSVSGDAISFWTASTPTGNFGSATVLTDPATTRTFTERYNSGDFAGIDLVSTSSTHFGFDVRGRLIDSSAAQLASDVVITFTSSRTTRVLAQTGKVSWQ